MWCKSFLDSSVCHDHIWLLSLPEETESHFQPEWQAGNSGSYLENSWEEQLLEQQDHLEKEMEEAKKMISGLQVIDCLLSQCFFPHAFLFPPAVTGRQVILQLRHWPGTQES